ncbi:MAG: hypothetical protein HY854_16075 [Burkholderiales bacterium]|nr:hypothetical protein [Burkholderiales bacterium]
MRASRLLVLSTALVAGFSSPHLADQLAGHGWAAELWFYAVVPAVLDVVPQGMAWLAAGVVYTLQYLAALSVIGAAWSAWVPQQMDAGSSPA